MKAGRLRHRVALSRLVTIRNPTGEAVESWAPAGSAWAEIEDLSGREWYEALQLPEGEVSTRVTIRYRPGVSRTMRVVAGARTFDIVAVIDRDGHRRALTLMCRELAP